MSGKSGNQPSNFFLVVRLANRLVVATWHIIVGILSAIVGIVARRKSRTLVDKRSRMLRGKR